MERMIKIICIEYSFQFKCFFDLSLNLIHNQNFKIGE